MGTNNTIFAGKTIVTTGELRNYTRDGIELVKIQQLGVKILTGQKFGEMSA